MRGSAFVTDGDQRATLAVVRALGGAGIAVTVGSTQATSLAGSSRYCSKQVRYPSPSQDGSGFQEFLSDELNRGGYRVLIPMGDITTWLASEARESIETWTELPIPGPDQIKQAQDKGQVLDLAQRLGIPCPAVASLARADDLAQAARRIGYPLVIKPRFSHFRRNGCWVSGPVQYAYSEQDLRQKYHECEARIPQPLIQERLSGEGRGVFLLVWDGQLKGAFCHRRLREKPPWGGVSVYRESIPLDEGLVEKSFTLLKALSWRGVAMIEFKMDARDGLPKLMEVNGRFWGSLQLAIDAGLNFPLLLYRLACGENVRPEFDYKIGVKSGWLLGDLDQLLIRLTRSGNGLPEGSKLKACAEFVKFRERDLHYEVFRRDDPRPGWFELKSYMREILRSVKGSRELSNES